MNYTFRQSADKLFRAAEAGSNAEKLTTLRKGMQLRRRELRETERTLREASRVNAQSPSATWRTTS
ncbi:hypothetical protein FHX15_005932 [Rhizobium sp. BK650]|nr:hypothetical protein [Rhizobium sp. BK650]